MWTVSIKSFVVTWLKMTDWRTVVRSTIVLVGPADRSLKM
jgi:hypothetical protein